MWSSQASSVFSFLIVLHQGCGKQIFIEGKVDLPFVILPSLISLQFYLSLHPNWKFASHFPLGSVILSECGVMFAVDWSSLEEIKWRGGCFVGSCRRFPSGWCCWLCSCKHVHFCMTCLTASLKGLLTSKQTNRNDPTPLFVFCVEWRSNSLPSTGRSSQRRCGCINSIG